MVHTTQCVIRETNHQTIDSTSHTYLFAELGKPAKQMKIALAFTIDLDLPALIPDDTNRKRLGSGGILQCGESPGLAVVTGRHVGF